MFQEINNEINKIESSLLYKISNLQQKLKENIEKNDKLKNQAFKMAITFYYIELFLSMNIFSIIFHIAHLIFNWSLKTKNSLQYVDLFSILGYAIMGICTYIPRRNTKFVYNLASANNILRRSMYILGCIIVQGCIVATTIIVFQFVYLESTKKILEFFFIFTLNLKKQNLSHSCN
jgi:hypothetical protein